MRVFIAKTKTILPPVYDPDYVIDRVYPEEIFGKKINKLAHKLARSIGIKKKPTAIDLDRLPEIHLKREEDHPLQWGKSLIYELSKDIGKENIGFLSVSYNISYHRDFLPNLASRLVMEMGLKTDIPPEEIPFYGCASGVYSLKSAFDYCRSYKKAAIVFTFDQCSHIGYFTRNPEDKYFKKTMKSNLLFSDGGVGVLLIPETMADKFDDLIEIVDFQLDFYPGDVIRMENGAFLLENRIKDEVPPLVSEKVIKPILDRNNLHVSDISQWALHQGGTTIMEKFMDPDVLGLTEKQIERAWKLFEEYGNMSSPSCLFVLDSFFNEKNKSDKNGIIVGFGAGYYMGSALYKWV